MNKSMIGKIEEFIPPEGVPIHFSIATMSARFGALMIDTVITTGSMVILILFISIFNFLSIQASLVLLIFLFYFTRVPYYLLSELIWNGQTLGKRMVGIRVINMSGQRLTPYQITARNLMKEIEILTPLTMIFFIAVLSTFDLISLFIWMFVVCFVIIKNHKNQRMGDIIAGTIVVNNPNVVLLADMAVAAPVSLEKQQLFDFKPEHLEFYGRFELQALEEILRDNTLHQNKENVRKIIVTIKNKIGYNETIKLGEEIAFLAAFYRAQRDYLEKLQLFGKRRDNKFYKYDDKEKRQKK